MSHFSWVIIMTIRTMLTISMAMNNAKNITIMIILTVIMLIMVIMIMVIMIMI